MNSLDRQEYELLIDALDALESKAMAGLVPGLLLDSMLRGREGQSPEQAASIAKAKMEQCEKQNRILKERTTILRAKLLLMRDGKDADAILRGAQA